MKGYLILNKYRVIGVAKEDSSQMTGVNLVIPLNKSTFVKGSSAHFKQ